MDPKKVSDLISEDRLKIKAIYDLFRNEFFGFARRYQLDDSDLSDIYQEAFLALMKHSKSGKLEKVKCSMKTYLFQIGKHMIYDLYKYKGKMVPYDANLRIERGEEINFTFDQSDALSAAQRELRKHFKTLDEKCRELLTLFYYRGLTLEEIAPKAGLRNANVAKVQKHRCLEKLRNQM
ncbi:MAG: sigma-70 family RNA polymerase sigma factor [Flavobacteriaceae bacterium]